MKKAIRNLIGVLVLTLAMLCAAGLAEADVALNSSNFPDANFLQYLRDAGFDADGDGSLSDTEISHVSSVNCAKKSISDLTGIAHFTALTKLYCYENQLTSLDVSKNTALAYLSCYSNRLTSLDVSRNTALKWLGCSSNQLTSLDASRNTALETLLCHDNRLTSLDVSGNTALTRLGCSSNRLKSLDVSNNTALTELYCNSNRLTSLDVSNNTALTRLGCSSNRLSKLNVTKNTVLAGLQCHGNPLKNLNVSKCPQIIEILKTETRVDKNTYWGYKDLYGNGYNFAVSFDKIVRVNLGGGAYIEPEEGKVAPTGITLNIKKATTLIAGETLTLKAILTPSYAETTLTWTSNDEEVATVSEEGVVTAVDKGKASATITVTTDNGLKASCKFNVRLPAATEVKLDKTGTVWLKLSKTLTLKATVYPERASQKVNWESGNNNIATVNSNGMVIPKAVGSADIRVKTNNGCMDYVTIVVVLPEARKVTLSKKGTVKLTVGKTLNLKATVIPELASQKVKWTSSNKKVAIVYSNGRVRAKATGVTTITAKTDNGKEAKVKIKVVKASTNDTGIPED